MSIDPTAPFKMQYFRSCAFKQGCYRSGKSGKKIVRKVRENACKVSKIFYFDLNILKTALWL